MPPKKSAKANPPVKSRNIMAMFAGKTTTKKTPKPKPTPTSDKEKDKEQETEKLKRKEGGGVSIENSDQGDARDFHPQQLYKDEVIDMDINTLFRSWERGLTLIPKLLVYCVSAIVWFLLYPF